MRRLTTLAIAVVLLCASAQAGARVLADREFYTRGPWSGYAAPWSTYGGTTMRAGVDFGDWIEVPNEAAFPVANLLWQWPATPPANAGVYGYNALSYGSYDSGTPQTPVPARRLREISALALTYSVSLRLFPNADANLLVEAYAFERPSSASRKLLEVGFLPRPSASGAAYARAGTRLGQVGIWTAWRRGDFVMLVPDRPVMAGTIDFKAAFDFLVAGGAVDGDAYFTGLAFGIEPVKGVGMLWGGRLAVDYR